MKEELKIKEISLTLSIVGMVLLLLLSPCKVRNFIQVELGLPQTDVLNKSQAIDSQSECQTFEVAKAVQSYSKPTVQQLCFLVADASHFEQRTYLPTKLFTPFTSENQLVPDIPLYILYQNLQIYS